MGVVLPHDRLDAYRASLDFVKLTTRIVTELPKGKAELADQFKRASFSIVLNVAEGSGEFSPKEKARFYRMALRSATECGAVLDILHCDGAVGESHFMEGRALLDRIVAMLTGLVRARTGA